MLICHYWGYMKTRMKVLFANRCLSFCFRMVILAIFTHLSNHLSSLSKVCSLLSPQELPLSFKWRQTAASWPQGFSLSLCFISWCIGLCICLCFGLHIARLMFVSVFFIEGRFLKNTGMLCLLNIILKSDTAAVYRMTYHISSASLLCVCSLIAPVSVLTKAHFR